MPDNVTPREDPADGFHVHIDTKNQMPIPAEIVRDRRDSLPRRLALVGVGALILWFTINGYIQSARNGEALRTARHDRTTLIQQGGGQTELLRQQQDLIHALEQVAIRQAQALQKAGLSDQIVTLPTPSPRPGESPRPSGTSSAPSPAPHPAQASPAPGRSPRPTPRPAPSPSPSSLVSICVRNLPCIHPGSLR